jgi:hypothetical protein
MSLNEKLRGNALMTGMRISQMVEVQVCTLGTTDVIRGPSPQDFGNTWYRARLTGIGTNGRVRAKFADPRITKHEDQGVSHFDDRQPPFRYMVRPLIRFMGTTGHISLQVGEPCVILIDDFRGKPETCANSPLGRDEILRLCPEELRGLWRGRVVQVSLPFEGPDGRMCSVSAVLNDDNLRESGDELVRYWDGKELPFSHQVWPSGALSDGVAALSQGWRTLRGAAGARWEELREQLNAAMEDPRP